MKLRCKRTELVSGEPKKLCPEGRAPVALFDVDGRFFATDDTCTHGEASLCDGSLSGHVIECPFHAGTFDVRTGAAIGYPATEPLKSYPVHTEGDEVVIDLG